MGFQLGQRTASHPPLVLPVPRGHALGLKINEGGFAASPGTAGCDLASVRSVEGHGGACAEAPGSLPPTANGRAAGAQLSLTARSPACTQLLAPLLPGPLGSGPLLSDPLQSRLVSRLKPWL